MIYDQVQGSLFNISSISSVSSVPLNTLSIKFELLKQGKRPTYNLSFFFILIKHKLQIEVYLKE